MNNLKELRLYNDLTQEEVAKRINVCRSHYTLIENGSRKPSFEVCLKLAEVFNTSVEDIFKKNSNF